MTKEAAALLKRGAATLHDPGEITGSWTLRCISAPYGRVKLCGIGLRVARPGQFLSIQVRRRLMDCS